MTRAASFFISVTSENLLLADLARLISRSPDEGWSKGDKHILNHKSKTYHFSRWAIVERACGTDNDWERAIDTLLARILPNRAELLALPHDAVVRFEVDLTEDNGVFGFYMSSAQLAVIASIGASLDLSVIVSSDQPGLP